MSRRCPHCDFSYAWDARLCGHCCVPYPPRSAWDACADPNWFDRHNPSATRRQLLRFGCAVVRPVLRFLRSEVGDVFARLEEAAAGGFAPGVPTPVLTTALVGVGFTLPDRADGPSAARAAFDALTHLAAAVTGGETADQVYRAVGMAARAAGCERVPATADDRVRRPAFLDDPTRCQELGLVPGRDYPDLAGRDLSPDEERRWAEWEAARRRVARAEHRRREEAAAVGAAHCAVYRDIVPYPFEPVAFDPAWRTSTAVALARGAAAGDFSVLPYLADALQDAGCEEPEILTHCRDPRREHVRGCWVVEAVLDGSA